MLSIWKWIVFKDFCLLKVKIANFTAFSSNTFMCNNYSSFDHCPPVDIPWHNAPQPFLDDLSVSVLDWETESSNDHCRFLSFLSTTAVLPWVSFLQYDLCVFNASICCCCRYWKFICAGSTAWIVSFVVLKSTLVFSEEVPDNTSELLRLSSPVETESWSMNPLSPLRNLLSV